MELVFIPMLAMGHLLSPVEVAKRIILRDQRLSISILIINGIINSSKITAFLDSKANDNPYPTRLNFITLPPLPNPPDPSSPNLFHTFLDLYKPIVKQAVEDRLQARSSKLVGFVFDMFYTTFMDVSNDFNVPFYVFFSSGANFLSLLFHSQSLADDQGVDVATKFNDPDGEFDIPGFTKRVSGKAIPAVLMDNKEIGTKTLLKMTRNFKKSKGILVNTFKELESCGVQALSDLVAECTSIPPIYPVGPILELDDITRDGTKDESQYKFIMEWLDDQPSSSVVFICFGSTVSVDEDQVKEIAEGLENSGHRFLWSLCKPLPEGKIGMPSDEVFVDALPEGFLDRTVGRGKVIGWAPQVSILAHSAIGGFVSRCGWNSTLESLWFGVPMATWPFSAEQSLNAFEVVKELGLGVEIRLDYKFDWFTRKANFMVTSEYIENGVKNLMSLDDETKNCIRQMSDASKNTLEEGGSSFEYMNCFIGDVLNIHVLREIRLLVHVADLILLRLRLWFCCCYGDVLNNVN